VGYYFFAFWAVDVLAGVLAVVSGDFGVFFGETVAAVFAFIVAVFWHS
jgi:hypothetical protein